MDNSRSGTTRSPGSSSRPATCLSTRVDVQIAVAERAAERRRVRPVRVPRRAVPRPRVRRRTDPRADAVRDPARALQRAPRPVEPRPGRARADARRRRRPARGLGRADRGRARGALGRRHGRLPRLRRPRGRAAGVLVRCGARPALRADPDAAARRHGCSRPSPTPASPSAPTAGRRRACRPRTSLRAHPVLAGPRLADPELGPPARARALRLLRTRRADPHHRRLARARRLLGADHDATATEASSSRGPRRSCSTSSAHRPPTAPAARN